MQTAISRRIDSLLLRFLIPMRLAAGRRFRRRISLARPGCMRQILLFRPRRNPCEFLPAQQLRIRFRINGSVLRLGGLR